MGSALYCVLIFPTDLILFPFASSLWSRKKTKSPVIKAVFPTKDASIERKGTQYASKDLDGTVVSERKTEIVPDVVAESVDIDELDDSELEIEFQEIFINSTKDLIRNKVFKNEFVVVCNESKKVLSKKPFKADIYFFHRLNLNYYDNSKTTLYIIFEESPDLVMQIAIDLINKPNLEIVSP